MKILMFVILGLLLLVVGVPLAIAFFFLGPVLMLLAIPVVIVLFVLWAVFAVIGAILFFPLMLLS